MAVALDSDALIAFLDRSDALHKPADAHIRSLSESQAFWVSVITYAEVLTGARLGHHDMETISGFFGNFVSRVVPTDVRVADRAAELRADNRYLKMPDALIVATADVEEGVELLLTGDKKLARIEGLDCEVRVLRPPA